MDPHSNPRKTAKHRKARWSALMPVAAGVLTLGVLMGAAYLTLQPSNGASKPAPDRPHATATGTAGKGPMMVEGTATKGGKPLSGVWVSLLATRKGTGGDMPSVLEMETDIKGRFLFHAEWKDFEGFKRRKGTGNEPSVINASFLITDVNDRTYQYHVPFHWKDRSWSSDSHQEGPVRVTLSLGKVPTIKIGKERPQELVPMTPVEDESGS